MANYLTTEAAIDKYRYAYYDLVDYEIRLDKEIYLMKKRIAKIAVDEAKYQARQQLLDIHLTELRERKMQFQTEDVPERYQKRKLEKLQKEIDKVQGRWHANRWHLSVVYKRKRKDNVTKLLLKETKQAEVQVRIQQTQQTLQQLIKIQQQEEQSILYSAKHQEAEEVKEQIQTTASLSLSSNMLLKRVILVALVQQRLYTLHRNGQCKVSQEVMERIRPERFA
ncbi:hypothetical protein QNI19_11790 [Cytophagaceae bacterium DM2B3-1]|uniref:Uncharacterized protein n=1 Tax=Xanthocytophaga flava TaxID=3048013 RepID=A0ABT7CIQ0_9BACT|nr:hypothetical protein [Xanthocytophaga flavus]MDJ1469669.1 hypothetical protein [Xanthocytophaga flavus]MDJ1493616.1 hypothetical protein [Xanthocytophaga flavus]